MFVIPSEKRWTLVVSKSTDTSGKYDEEEDLFRVPMDYGVLPSLENEFSIYFAHVAPEQCSMRLDLGKSRAWVIFQERVSRMAPVPGLKLTSSHSCEIAMGTMRGVLFANYIGLRWYFFHFMTRINDLSHRLSSLGGIPLPDSPFPPLQRRSGPPSRT